MLARTRPSQLSCELLSSARQAGCHRFFHNNAVRHDGSNTSKRRAVSVINDTGRVPWESLSTGEKAARTTQQTFNLGIILLGLGATGAVFTVLWLEVFSTDSKTAIFNRAADRVRKDAKSLELLAGEGLHTKREISAHGEPSWSRWARNRTIASSLEKDRAGIEHLKMHFYVEGPAANGTVNLHMIKRPGEADFQYQYLALDVPGQPRHYLENASELDQRRQGKLSVSDGIEDKAHDEANDHWQTSASVVI